MTQLLKAAPVVQSKIQYLKQALSQMEVAPTLCVVQVGNHPASNLYIENKKKKVEEIGAKFELLHFPEDIEPSEFLAQVKSKVNSPHINGMIIQLPLPKALKSLPINTLIPAHKDVDGFHPDNTNQLYLRQNPDLIACTPKGILSLLKYYNISLEGKNVCLIGRSFIVGSPLALLLNQMNATVTLCHSHTKNLKDHTQKADIIISAIGSANKFNSEFLASSKHQILIDVGISKLNGKTTGDFDFHDCKNHSHAITPVPGGVGPMTVISLVENLIIAAQNQKANL